MVFFWSEALQHVCADSRVALREADVGGGKAELGRGLAVEDGALEARLHVRRKRTHLVHLGHLKVHVPPEPARALADRVAVGVWLFGEVREIPVVCELGPLHVRVRRGVVRALLEALQAQPLAQGVVSVGAEELCHANDAGIPDAKVLGGGAVHLRRGCKSALVFRLSAHRVTPAQGCGRGRFKGGRRGGERWRGGGGDRKRRAGGWKGGREACLGICEEIAHALEVDDHALAV